MEQFRYEAGNQEKNEARQLVQKKRLEGRGGEVPFSEKAGAIK